MARLRILSLLLTLTMVACTALPRISYGTPTPPTPTPHPLQAALEKHWVGYGEINFKTADWFTCDLIVDELLRANAETIEKNPLHAEIYKLYGTPTDAERHRDQLICEVQVRTSRGEKNLWFWVEQDRENELFVGYQFSPTPVIAE